MRCAATAGAEAGWASSSAPALLATVSMEHAARKLCMPKPNWPLTKDAPRLRDSPTRMTTCDSVDGGMPLQLSTIRSVRFALETKTSMVTSRA